MTNTKPNKSIKQWAFDDRPREKMLSKGKGALSNAELIAILIGSGWGEKSALTLAQEILEESDNNLYSLSRRTIEEFTQHRGIGEAKAISIVAALELGRRESITPPIERTVITNSREAYESFLPYLDNPNTESFFVTYLNQGNKIIKTERISIGGITSTLADPKVIFKSALLKEATAIIIGHNHPSGDVTPSREDALLTQKICSAGKLLDINVFDHIIIGEKEYYSFADHGRC